MLIRLRGPAAALVLALVAGIAVACGSDSPAERLAAALTAHEPTTAAPLTTDPVAASKTLVDTFDGMGDATVDVEVNDDDTEFTWTWHLPRSATSPIGRPSSWTATR
ncbi:hypothetical protein ACFOJ6_08980 [Gordonia humi]|uniref:hypothetical protein n=1 Tax=Gordonia humi TaxID=686429 RepID=UPI00361B38BE